MTASRPAARTWSSPGLVTSFTLVTLVGTVLLKLLGLPQDLLRWAGIAVLALLGLGLLIPRFEEVLERPFQRLTPKRAPGPARGGFVLGLGLGAVYVPCAGPVLAAITVAGATGKIGRRRSCSPWRSRSAPRSRCSSSRSRAAGWPSASRRSAATSGGSVRRRGAMIALAVALKFNVTDAIQRAHPGLHGSLQAKVAANETVRESSTWAGWSPTRTVQLAECAQRLRRPRGLRAGAGDPRASTRG